MFRHKKKKAKSIELTAMFAALMVTIALFFNGYAYLTDKEEVEVDYDMIEEKIEEIVDKKIAAMPKPQAAAPTPTPAPAPTRVEGDFTDDDAILGNPNAPVTIIEWSDYECPFCKRFSDNTLPELKEKYIDTGKVKLVFRDYPLNFHQNAMPAAVAAECAREQGGDDMYYKYHDKIFQNQTQLFDAKLKQMAADLGLNTEDFANCLDNQNYRNEAQQDMADGAKIGIRGTPGFLINGQILSGARPFSAFEQIIEAELNK